MHHASLSTSPRLQRALHVLQEAQGWLSTRTLIRRAHICAVNSVIAELRENGAEIECEQRVGPDGTHRWCYRLTKSPEVPNG
ncbi:hypothetical protein DDZ14_16260 [Maritimibacter sp. 55A14]|uniref:hypothetical protein n=1 Tax=Maritimibacter sp. 55A14 TaxID=2174844 RepID=UPI000D61BE73|nr:hypothetical protein [Maritimibacter sp. 55A14]PWE29993.1 hypothetical protein DDZ14_16260 [Maritimibacter sp. 55A14]